MAVTDKMGHLEQLQTISDALRTLRDMPHDVRCNEQSRLLSIVKGIENDTAERNVLEVQYRLKDLKDAIYGLCDENDLDETTVQQHLHKALMTLTLLKKPGLLGEMLNN